MSSSPRLKIDFIPSLPKGENVPVANDVRFEVDGDVYHFERRGDACEFKDRTGASLYTFQCKNLLQAIIQEKKTVAFQLGNGFVLQASTAPSSARFVDRLRCSKRGGKKVGRNRSRYGSDLLPFNAHPRCKEPKTLAKRPEALLSNSLAGC